MGQTVKTVHLKTDDFSIGVDQVKLEEKDVDLQVIIELQAFLENYFCQEVEDEDAKWISSIDNGLTKDQLAGKPRSNSHEDHQFDNVRAIPGGRYGCAQFVKICGPETLKRLSLGKIA